MQPDYSSTTAESGTTLDELPAGILSHILAHLPLQPLLCAMCTCRSWRALAAHALSACDTLTCPGDKTALVLVWLGTSPHAAGFRTLNLNGAAVAPGLTFLSSSSLGRDRLRQLTTIVIDSCRQLKDSSLGQALQCCPALQFLTLINCSRLTDAAAVHIGTHCPDLRTLHLLDIFSLYDKAVSYLTRHCTRLTSLSLDGALHLILDCLAIIGDQAPQLHYLSVAKCTKLRDVGLQALARGCPDLVHLNLSQCHRLSHTSCLAAATHLAHLDLRGLAQVSESELLGLLRSPSLSTSLTSLSLDGCGGVTGQVVACLGRTCQCLTSLDLSRSRGLHDFHLVEYAAACSGGALRHLSLVWCSQVTDVGATAMVAANPGLHHLEVEGCFLVTDALLAACAGSAPGLRSLNLRLCSLLTAPALLACVEALNRLGTLQVSGVVRHHSVLWHLAAAIKQARAGVRLVW